MNFVVEESSQKTGSSKTASQLSAERDQVEETIEDVKKRKIEDQYDQMAKRKASVVRRDLAVL